MDAPKTTIPTPVGDIGGSRVLGVADARLVWVKYYDGKEGKEQTILCTVNFKGEVTVLNTKDLVRGQAQSWLAEQVCKRLGVTRTPADAALPKNDFQGG